MNKVTLIGYLGEDPQNWTTANGQAVTRLRLATTEKYLDKNTGKKREKTQWHTLMARGRLGEICSKFLKKGSHICAEGKLTYRQWEDHNDHSRTSAEICLESLLILQSEAGEKRVL